MDKFRLFKLKVFQISIKHNISIDKIIHKSKPFEVVLDCGCVDNYGPGYYYSRYIGRLVKITDI